MRLGQQCISGLLCFAMVSPVWAHKLILNVYASAQQIEGELGFSDGKMVNGAIVRVEDGAGKLLHEATTDAEGFFALQRSHSGAMVLRANTGSGHIATVEVAALVASGTNSPAPTRASAEDESQVLLTGAEVAEVVRQELRPVRQELARLKEKNGIQDIIGGIGYILGLFGIGYYVAAKSRLRARGSDDD
jgi:nickel transport protein